MAAPMLGDLAAVDVDHDFAMRDTDAHPSSGQSWRCRVVNIADAAETVPTHPHLGATVGIRSGSGNAYRKPFSVLQASATFAPTLRW
ncbi:MAG: hypothetical protein OXS29_18940 [bacterium]|nr:hypothetical protein [bacterium]MDE0290049.1 hypothetical protein [bacterium]MDE0439500.1 hypothetical protein [bacterium]